MKKEKENGQGALVRQNYSHKPSPITSLTSKYGDLESFCKAYSPDKIITTAMVAERAVTSSVSPALSVIKRAYGEKAPQSWLIRLLSSWQEAMPVKGKMPTVQLHLLCENIVREFYWLTASEIMLFLGRLMGGSYGVNWYNGISPDIILETLRTKFMDERDGILHRKSLEKIKEEKSEPITWEEYCQRHGIKDRPHPLTDIKIGK